MGAKIPLLHMSNVQLQAHIRQLALDSGKVFFVDHVRLRMQERGVNDMAVLMCLRAGVIQRPPKKNKNAQTVRARMEHFGPVRNLSVVVELDDREPDCWW